jgi:hypothetical protein
LLAGPPMMNMGRGRDARAAFSNEACVTHPKLEWWLKRQPRVATRMHDQGAEDAEKPLSDLGALGVSAVRR